MQFKIPESTNETGRLIPFGKYKGQPLETLANDREYSDWLMQQGWFREKFPQFVQVIVNNFGEPTESPEHNQMQARFLDREWQAKFTFAVRSDLFTGQLAAIEDSIKKRLSKVVAQPERVLEIDCHVDLGPVLSFSFDPEFESGKSCNDVRMNFYQTVADDPQDHWEYCKSCGRRHFLFAPDDKGVVFLIEIKPSIGDDYPAILRQMKSNGSKFLLYRNYSGTGVSESVFRSFFASQGIQPVRESEIEHIVLPEPEILTLDWFTDIVKQYLNPFKIKVILYGDPCPNSRQTTQEPKPPTDFDGIFGDL